MEGHAVGANGVCGRLRIKLVAVASPVARHDDHLRARTGGVAAAAAANRHEKERGGDPGERARDQMHGRDAYRSDRTTATAITKADATSPTPSGFALTGIKVNLAAPDNLIIAKFVVQP
jgi:hypothetical protein